MTISTLLYVFLTDVLLALGSYFCSAPISCDPKQCLIPCTLYLDELHSMHEPGEYFQRWHEKRSSAQRKEDATESNDLDK